MAASSVLKLEKYGSLEIPVPNAPFSVEDARTVWLVGSGKLDLFLINEKKNGELVGARHHVLRVDEGQAVFGVGSHLKTAVLTASAAPGTQLLRLSIDQLCHLDRSEEHTSE